MTNFWRRLRYYGIGFGIGLIFVIFFFQNRGCSWTPSNRVKTALLERALVLPSTQVEDLKKINFNPQDLPQFIEDADVDFGASKKEKPNKYYKLVHKEKALFFTLTNESFVSSVFTSKPKRKDSETGNATFVYFPGDKDLVFTDTSGTSQRVRSELGFKNDQAVLKMMKKKCVLSYDKSDFKNAIKPEHFLMFKDGKGNEIGAIAVWYKDKINITSYISADTLQ